MLGTDHCTTLPFLEGVSAGHVSEPWPHGRKGGYVTSHQDLGEKSQSSGFLISLLPQTQSLPSGLSERWEGSHSAWAELGQHVYNSSCTFSKPWCLRAVKMDKAENLSTRSVHFPFSFKKRLEQFCKILIHGVETHKRFNFFAWFHLASRHRGLHIGLRKREVGDVTYNRIFKMILLLLKIESGTERLWWAFIYPRHLLRAYQVQIWF